MVTGWPECGFVRFPWNAETHNWAMAALRSAKEVVQEPAMRAQWLQCEGTWFVGVDALPTEANGAITGTALPKVIRDRIGGRTDLHRAQLSVTYPGYPRPRQGESDAAFHYRLKRDAAHMDGLLGEGSPKRRYLRERHDWILGIPLTETSPGASPLVVWEASHRVLQAALIDALADRPASDWAEQDITDVYVAARNRVFSSCRRVSLFTRPGEAVLLNPFLLHGVAPWQQTASASRHGRMIAYFRPETAESGAIWLRQK